MLVKDIAQKVGAEFTGDGEIEIHRVANLITAQEGEISFLSDMKYGSVLVPTKAG